MLLECSQKMHAEYLQTEYLKYIKKLEVGSGLESAKQKLEDAKSGFKLIELEQRKHVLRRLNYCKNNDVIKLKGKVACELST